jgi:NAD(P)-dependent dehydrogenase (short-subunit alcohol dehydrogenase family)
MTIAGKAVLVTGANRGIGQALVEEALRRGAGRVYAGARQPLAHPDGRVTHLTLDVTNAAQIQAAVERVESLDILINNAGIALYDDLSNRSVLEQHLAVNLFGTYGVTQAFWRSDSLQGSHRQQRVDDGHGPFADHSGLRHLKGGCVQPDPITARPSGRPKALEHEYAALVQAEPAA